MKIAMVGQFPPHIGGVGVHIHTLAKELVKQGHTVYVITYPHKDLKDIDGIHVIGTSGLNIPGFRGLFFKINAQKALKKLVEKEDIDIIHGHYLFPAGLSAVEIATAKNIKSYVTSHGSDMFELYKKHPLARPIIKKVLKKADVVLAVSNALKDEILKTKVENIDEKTRIHLNSVDIDKFKELNQDKIGIAQNKIKQEFNLNDKPIVLFVGNIIRRKNVISLIEAKKLSKMDYQLLVVGGGPLLKNLKEKVLKEKIKDVIFTGKREDIEDIIPIADLLVLPSLSESFGLVLIEALACGKPVIGSNVGGIKEIISPDVGLLVNPKDYSEIAISIEKILKDNDLKEKFSKNARNRAKDFAQMNLPYDELK